jgi:hypothetical protein
VPGSDVWDAFVFLFWKEERKGKEWRLKLHDAYGTDIPNLNLTDWRRENTRIDSLLFLANLDDSDILFTPNQPVHFFSLTVATQISDLTLIPYR